MAQADTLDVLTMMSVDKADREIQSLQKKIAILQRDRNTHTSSFRRVSNDVAVEIFKAYHADAVSQDNGNNVRSLIQVLRLVCFHWNQLIENTPRLWSYMKIGLEYEGFHPPFKPWICQHLFWSRNIPLDIEIKYPPRYDDTGTLQDRMELMTDLILPKICQWRSFSFWYPGSTFDQHLEGFQKSAPRIERFIARSYDLLGSTLIPIPKLFNDDAPRLRHLEISNLATSWDSSFLKNLTKLTILAWDGVNTPSEEQYHLLFKRCPELEDLQLAGRAEDLDGPGLRFRMNAHLPRLRRLRLDTIHASTSRSLLSSIRGTQCSDITLRGVKGNSLPDLAVYSILTPILLSPHTISVDFQQFTLKSKSGCFTYGSTSSSWFSSGLTAITSSMNPLTVRTLDIYYSEGCFNQPNLLTAEQFLGRLVNVEDLHMGACEALLHALCRPQQCPEGPNWFLPNLRTFETGDYDTLLEFLEGRYSEAGQLKFAKSNTKGDAPALLDLVTFEYDLRDEGDWLLQDYDSDRRAAVDNIVGSYALIWRNGESSV